MLISFALSVNKTVSKIGTGETKPLGKIEIIGANVKPFKSIAYSKIPMLGDVL
jgi:DNA polymerase-4